MTWCRTHVGGWQKHASRGNAQHHQFHEKEQGRQGFNRNIYWYRYVLWAAIRGILSPAILCASHVMSCHAMSCLYLGATISLHVDMSLLVSSKIHSCRFTGMNSDEMRTVAVEVMLSMHTYSQTGVRYCPCAVCYLLLPCWPCALTRISS